MEDILIRRATAEDIPSLDRLLYQVHAVHNAVRPDLFKAGAKKYTDKELEKIISDGNTPVFVAVIGGDIAGYAFCIHRQLPDDGNMTSIKTLYIDDLCVDEKIRGKHIGTELYNYALKYAEACGCYNLTLNVWADNTDAVKFYEKIGMRVQKIGMEKIL